MALGEEMRFAAGARQAEAHAARPQRSLQPRVTSAHAVGTQLLACRDAIVGGNDLVSRTALPVMMFAEF